MKENKEEQNLESEFCLSCIIIPCDEPEKAINLLKG